MRRQDVRRAQALGAEACRKPKWRPGVPRAADGAWSVSERVFCKTLWRTPSSPPWPGIGMFEAITTMKVGGKLMPRCHSPRVRRHPSLLASPWICLFLDSGASLEFRGGSVGEDHRPSACQGMAWFYVVIPAGGVELLQGRGGAVPRRTGRTSGRSGRRC